MVVTCAECHTKFVLDEDRIKGPEVKVRCSRCGNVFSLPGPGEQPASAEPEEAEPAAAGLLQEKQEEPQKGRPQLEEEIPLALEEREEEELEPSGGPAAAFPQPSILITGPAKRSSWKKMALISGGIIAGLLVCGAAVWFWGYPWFLHKFKGKTVASPVAKAPASGAVEIISPPPLPAASPEDLKDLELISQEERYRGLVNYKGGQLLLIQGKVKNSSSQPRGPIQIKAVLTNPQHKAVNQREFYAGTVIFDDELQNLDPEEINRWLETPGGRAQKQVLEPGETQSFMVVFFDAPQNLTGFGYKLQVVKGAVAAKKSTAP